MNNKSKGLIYLVLGILVVVITSTELVIRLGFLSLGIYLIYTGLKLRNPAFNMFFLMQRFMGGGRF